MTSPRDRIPADIPADAIADAVAAVERSERRASHESVRRGAPGSAQAAVDPPAEDACELERLRAELALSQEASRKVFAQLREEHERLLRAAADHENYRKRAQRERDEVLRHGNERLVRELLPVLDGLDRVLAVAAADDALASGVGLTRRLFEEALGRFGVKAFTARGERFDPRIHEALMTVATTDALPGMVVDEQHRGFFMNDRLVRPAAVVVAAAPEPEPEPEPETAAGAVGQRSPPEEA